MMQAAMAEGPVRLTHYSTFFGLMEMHCHSVSGDYIAPSAAS